MSPFEVLRKDHAAINGLLEKLNLLPQTEQALREDTFHQLRTHIEMHNYVEETFFYPQLKRKPETSPLADRSANDHQQVNTLLEEMSRALGDGERFNSFLSQLKENLQEHIQEEEALTFVKAREVLSVEEWDEIGTRMDRERSEQLTAK